MRGHDVTRHDTVVTGHEKTRREIRDMTSRRQQLPVLRADCAAPVTF